MKPPMILQPTSPSYIPKLKKREKGEGNRERETRGRSSSKQGIKIDKFSKLKEEPHLSGAYIRRLVKQLTSSRTKDAMNPKDQHGCVVDGFAGGQNMTKFSEGLSENKQTQQPQQQHKKQVRRRLHTSRPYQERLLNMAEARREIVTALKFHRAAMKQAIERQQQQQNQQEQHPQRSSLPLRLSTPPSFEQEGKIKSRRNPRIYPSSTVDVDFFKCVDNFSYTSFSSPPPPSLPPPPYPFSRHTSILAPTVIENLNFPLPNQTLGLNLNFHDFNNIDTNLYHSINNSSSVYSPSFPSSSSFPSLSIATEEIPSVDKTLNSSSSSVPPAVSDATDSYGGGGLHQVMDDEEMAEIRSLGEQHQMEWNDTMNLVTSAWWFKFMKTMELSPEVKAEDIDGYHPFDQVMEFPAWLNANDACLLQRFNDYRSQDSFHDAALPCMDIGEIEGMDGEWLA